MAFYSLQDGIFWQNVSEVAKVGESVWFTTLDGEFGERTPLRVGLNFGNHGISWADCRHDLSTGGGSKLAPSLQLTPLVSHPTVVQLSFSFGSCTSSLLLVQSVILTICLESHITDACQGKIITAEYVVFFFVYLAAYELSSIDKTYGRVPIPQSGDLRLRG